jgi:Domain of unknown function (DUF1707)
MVTGPGDKQATAGRGCPPAEHADREQAIDTLKAAFVQGRLAKGEFDARVSRALESGTRADLAVLTADLPAAPKASRPLERVPVQGGKPVVRPSRMIMAATAIYAVIWPFTFALPWPTNAEGDPPAALIMLFVSATVTYPVIVLIAVANMIARWHAKRSGGQPLPRPATGMGD